MINPHFESHQCLFAGTWKRMPAILATKWSADVVPEVNLWEHVICTPPPSTNKAAHSGLKPRVDVTSSPKQGLSVTQQKLLMSFNIFFKKSSVVHLNQLLYHTNVWRCIFMVPVVIFRRSNCSPVLLE